MLKNGRLKTFLKNYIAPLVGSKKNSEDLISNLAHPSFSRIPSIGNMEEILRQTKKGNHATEASDDDYTSIRSNGLGPLHGHYPVYVLPSDRHNVDDLRAYLNLLNLDPYTLRKLMVGKLLNQLASVENQGVEDTSAKIKKNFDEIDKTSASFSTLNQLL
uniref:Uncharacterized protein n=1 Tax=Glossina pallidipes TaxID=7398 RepID=A0A1A9ZV18_GLOPL